VFLGDSKTQFKIIISRIGGTLEIINHSLTFGFANISAPNREF